MQANNEHHNTRVNTSATQQPHNKSVHTSTYCWESAFSTMNMVKNKYRSTLTNEHLHQCLRLAFTPFMAKFKPQKSVTFHTNKATSPFVHSSNVFVGVMFLDFDRPDPGLNGNLASGPFGFLIEYTCSTVSLYHSITPALLSIHLSLQHCSLYCITLSLYHSSSALYHSITLSHQLCSLYCITLSL